MSRDCLHHEWSWYLKNAALLTLKVVPTLFHFHFLRLHTGSRKSIPLMTGTRYSDSLYSGVAFHRTILKHELKYPLKYSLTNVTSTFVFFDVSLFLSSWPLAIRFSSSKMISSSGEKKNWHECYDYTRQNGKQWI